MAQTLTLFSRIQFAIRDMLPFLATSAILFLLMVVGIRRGMIARPRKMGTVLSVNLLFFLCFLLIGLVIAEGFFRFIYDATDNLFFLQTTQQWMRRHVVTNSDRFRDSEFSGIKEPGIFRIGILGDSYTYGQGIKKIADRFSNLLARNLAPNMRVEVYNLARGGFTTRDEIDALLNPSRPLSQYNFDLLLLAYVPNDIRGEREGELLESEQYYAAIRNQPPLKTIFDHSVALEFFFFHLTAYQTLIQQEQGNVAQWYEDPETWAEHEKTLAFLLHATRASQTPLAIILLPFLSERDRQTVQETHRKVQTFFTKNNVPVLDLLPILRPIPGESLVVSTFDTHPNENAHRKIADVVTIFLKDERLLHARSKWEEQATPGFMIPTCAPPIPDTRANANALTLLGEGYALPRDTPARLGATIASFSASWQARQGNRGLWQTCPHKIFIEPWTEK